MANKSISQLTAGAAVSGTDLFPDVQTVGVGPVKVTATQLATFFWYQPTLVAPSLGAATATSINIGGATLGSNVLAYNGSAIGTSLALGGATIGTNALAVTGTTLLGGATTVSTGGLTLGVQQTTQGTLVLANTAAGAYPVTLQSSNSTSAAWTMTLPVTAGSNGYILTTNGSGVTSWSNPTALGVDLDVGSTAITGGTSGRVLYDNAGVLGEYTVTGTAGSVVLSNSPTFDDDITLGTQQTTRGSIVLANTAAGAYSVTLQSSNSTSAAWTMTLPTTAGTNTYLLTTDGSGNMSWTNPTTIGGLPGGTNGQIQYNNSSSFGGISAITTNGSNTMTFGTQQTTQGAIVLANTAAGSFATTIQSSNSASAAWTLTLPTTAGTNNYVLSTNGSGVTSWVAQSGGGATGGGTDAIFWNNDQTVTTNYSIPSGKNSGTFGPISINSGVTVTVPSGSTWTVV